MGELSGRFLLTKLRWLVAETSALQASHLPINGRTSIPSPLVRRTYKSIHTRNPVRYILFVCVDPEAEPYVPQEDNIEDWVAEMDQRNVRIVGSRLKELKDARTIRRRNGKVIVTDGPFAETKEWIAGFDLLECANLHEAIEVASQHPMARFGRLEIRPLWPEE
jgi:hypothetical protein